MRRALLLAFALASSGQALADTLATAPATLARMAQEQRVEGVVQAVRESTVSAETRGRVAEILYDVGDTVPAGAVILRLVGIEQRQQLAQAEAAVREARAAREAEQLQYQRVQALAAKQMASRAELDNSTSRFRAAEARLAAAEAGMKSAREQVSYTEVRAPYGGRLSKRHVELGEAVQPGTPLMSGFDPAALRVEGSLPQSLAPAVDTHRAARVLRDDGTALLPTRLLLFPDSDPATGTVRVRLELPEIDTGLRPGQYVAIAFTTGEEERLTIPAQSVVHRAEVSGAYVVRDGRAILRQLRLGATSNGQVEVLAGLRPGEAVALDPVAAGMNATRERADEQ